MDTGTYRIADGRLIIFLTNAGGLALHQPLAIHKRLIYMETALYSPCTEHAWIENNQAIAESIRPSYRQFDDDAPGWSLEADGVAAKLGAAGLSFSRPLDVWRVSDHSDYQKAIREIQDQTTSLYLRSELPESLSSSEGAGRGERALLTEIASNPHQSYVSELPSRTKESIGKLRKFVRIVILDALIGHAQSPDLWIGYSRNERSYRSLKSRYNRLHITPKIIGVIDWLASLGYLDHWKAPQGHRGLQSRFRASPQLVGLFKRLAAPCEAVERDYSLREPIILRGEKPEAEYGKGGKAKQKPAPILEYDDEDHDGPARWRENVRTINQQIATSELGLDIDPKTRKDLAIDYSRVWLYRVFNNADWQQGGRFYGGWWQGVPSKLRPRLTIDRQPTVEIDFSQIHPLMLYAQADMRQVERDGVQTWVAGNGMPVPSDCYAVGFDRDMAKVAFQVMLNTPTRHGLSNALTRRADEKGYSRDQFKACAAALEQLHQPIASAFCTGAGLLLQRRDADLAEAILLHMARRGITVLPIHDSFIVQADYDGLLLSVMGDLLREHIPELANMKPARLFKVVRSDSSETKL